MVIAPDLAAAPFAALALMSGAGQRFSTSRR